MLQGIRASTLAMPSFGHNLSLTGVQKMEGYGDVDPWSWNPQQSPNSSSQSYNPIFDPSLYANFTAQPPTTSGNVQPRHHSIATSHVITTPRRSHNPTPPPARQHTTGALVKAQPAFKPTWNGFLDTTKDAMTIVEAALQGRLSHISRRPHDKERAEMLTSGTVIVYEENASGIKRWTDAVHWSPSRVMNNCLIYRQLIRALKPEEKKSALNPTCGGKRKRKESASPSITNTGDNVNTADDEYENPSFDGTLTGDATPTTEPLEKVYANFAQSLTPDQQRRFCGSLIDSYEFKEGGLMKKTISVKYQGTHHHVISYYSLEDVVNGKLKRPFEDPKLADIQPRPELLTGWKVSLEDEESKDLPLVAAYSQHMSPSHVQHQVATGVTQGISPQGMMQGHGSLHVQVPAGYWHGTQVSQYTATQQSSQHYSLSEHTASQYPVQQPSQQYTTHHQPATQQYASPQPSTQHYSAQTSSQHFTGQQQPVEQYHSQPSQTHSYTPPPSRPAHQYHPEPSETPAQHYPPQQTASYVTSHHTAVAHQPQYTVQHAPVFELPMHIPQSHTPAPHSAQSPHSQHDPQRRASAPVTMQSYGQPPHPQQQYHTTQQPQSYYAADQKYPGGPGYGF